jgi:hypothetical protein
MTNINLAGGAKESAVFKTRRFRPLRQNIMFCGSEVI